MVPYVSGFEYEVRDWMGTLIAVMQKCNPAPKRERKACGKTGHISVRQQREGRGDRREEA